MITLVPSAGPRRSATSRATMSVPLPAVKGTISLIVWPLGQSPWAWAPVKAQAASVAAISRRRPGRNVVMILSPLNRRRELGSSGGRRRIGHHQRDQHRPCAAVEQLPLLARREAAGVVGPEHLLV